MRIQLFSDLHLERYPDFRPQFLPGADVIVLAGDIGSYQQGSRLASQDFGLERFSPHQAGLAGKPVLFIPGNHEFDGLDYDETYARLRATCEHLGITWLDREVVTIDHVRFIGTTLWSDFEALAVRETDLTKQLQQRTKAFRAANYYLAKNTTLMDGEPVLAEGWRALALDCQAWLREMLATPFDGKTVVVTHFAPSLLSADPRYGVTPGTAGFCNALDGLFKGADVWMHGHLHCMNDYVAEGRDGAHSWACRVVANPLGYLSKGEQDGYRPELLIAL
jgi:predicted phosphodiesterase